MFINNTMRFTINTQIVLIAMLPVVLIDIFFTYHHVTNSIRQAENLLQSKGEIITRQISDTSEYYLFSGNFSELQRLLHQNVNNEEVVYAAIYNHDNQLLAEAVSQHFQPSQSHHYFYYRNDIVTEDIVESDIFDPTADSILEQKLGWIQLYVSKAPLEQSRQHYLIQGTAFFFTMLLIAGLLTTLISRRISIPIHRLMDHLNEVEKGNLGSVVKQIEKNEIGDLQRGFNSMTQSLLIHNTEMEQKIDQATNELKVAVKSLEKKNAELLVARDSAQKADEIKSRFLANMSHEIRTPLNGIQGFAKLLLKSELNHDQTRYASIIHQSTQDLSNIVNEVLDFSKLESGKSEIFEAPFNLHELLEHVRDSLYAVTYGLNIDFNLIIYSDTPRMLIGDSNHLRQVLMNLIGNAIKFTEQGYVAITVILMEENDHQVDIQFKIEDSGIGISEDDQKTLFTAFAQLESGSNRRYTGTGLGLVISKNLARLMGGDITLKSEVGVGTTFTVNLPFRPLNIRPELKKPEPANPFEEQMVLIYSVNQRCLNELQSLYNRVGFNSEAILIDATLELRDLDILKQRLRQSRKYTDLVVFDLRHNPKLPSMILEPDIEKDISVVVMHYDISMIDQTHYSAYRFISVVNTCKNLTSQLRTDSQQNIHASSIFEADSVSSEQKKKILIVDDNPINLTLATELTRMWGHDVTGAKNARQAYELFTEQIFDLILLDIQMPEIDGIELMQMMRKNQPELTTPIIALSATNLITEKDRLLELGFDSFLSKPIDEAKLQRLLNQEPSTTHPFNETMPGKNPDMAFDYTQTLRQAGQNAELVNDIMCMLKTEIPDHIEELKNANKILQLDDISRTMHKLHGITCYTSIPQVKLLIDEYQTIKYGATESIFELSRRMINALQQLDMSLDQHIS